MGATAVLSGARKDLPEESRHSGLLGGETGEERGQRLKGRRGQSEHDRAHLRGGKRAQASALPQSWGHQEDTPNCQPGCPHCSMEMGLSVTH